MTIAPSTWQVSKGTLVDTGPGAVLAEDAFTIRTAIHLLWRGKWLIAVCALIGLCLAAAVTASQPPRYTAHATVLYGPNDKTFVDIQAVVSRRGQSAMRDQIEILRSTDLLDRVVADLGLETSPAFAPAADGAGSTPWFDWHAIAPGVLRVFGQAAATELAPRDVAQRELALRQAREAIRAGLELLPLPNSNVIEIAYTTGNPRLSADVVNAVAGHYITAQLDATLKVAREATLWLTARVADLRADVEKAEAAVAAYRAELAAAVGHSAEVLEQQLGELNRNLSQAAARRTTAGVRFRRAAGALEEDARIVMLSDFEASDLMRSYRAQEADLTSDRAALAKLVPAGHERLVAIDGRIAHGRETMRAEAERITEALGNEYEIARVSEADLTDKAQRLERRIQQQDGKRVHLRELEREADASRIIYQNFLARLKETTQQEKLADGDAVILSPAEPPQAPDLRGRRRLLIGGVSLGTMLGFGLIFLGHHLNNTFRGIEEVQRATGLAVLGAIPTVGRRRRRRQVLQYAIDRPTSPLAEAVRNLRTSLAFSNIDRPPRVVMLASSLPSEGKSTTAILLALMSAQMGRSAIVVDCDLRRPSVHDLLEARPDGPQGLVDVLEGVAPLDEAIEEDPETSLHFLTTRLERQLPNNAADILASSRFQRLIEELKAIYDLVVIDAPPVLSVTDSRLICRVADAVIYCVEWDRTPRAAVIEGLREFQIIDQKIAGIVLTKVERQKAPFYGYGDRGYGYVKGRRPDPYLDA